MRRLTWPTLFSAGLLAMSIAIALPSSAWARGCQSCQSGGGGTPAAAGYASGYYGPGYGPGYGSGGAPYQSYAPTYAAAAGPAVAGQTGSGHWAPGGYEARVGSPYYYHDPAGGEYVVTGNPYYDHFGPGFHRDQLHGHYRFPYYNYRAPWYYPGRAVYNRDTNFPW